MYDNRAMLQLVPVATKVSTERRVEVFISYVGCIAKCGRISYTQHAGLAKVAGEGRFAAPPIQYQNGRFPVNKCSYLQQHA